MRDFEPQALYARFLLSDAEMHRTPDDDALIAEVKHRIARMLADKLADHLMDTKGGAVYSPVTFTIMPDDFGMTQVQGTVNALRLPDPETGEFELHGGPLHRRIIRVGDPAPNIYRIPVVQPLGFAPLGEPVIAEYERIPGVQAYRWRR